MEDSELTQPADELRPPSAWGWLKHPWVLLIFGGLLLLGVWIGAGVFLEHRRAEIIKTLQGREGIKLGYNHMRYPLWLPEFIGKRLPRPKGFLVRMVSNADFSGAVSPADLALVNRLPEISSFSFEDATELSEAQWIELLEAHEVEWLEFTTPRRLADTAFAALSRNGKLTHLSVLAGPFKQSAIDALGQQRDLKTLRINGAATTADLTCLAKLPELADLDWRNSDLSDQQLAQLAASKSLNELKLTGTNLTTRSWPVLGALRVESLWLEDPQINDDTLREVSKNHSLLALAFRGGTITDAGVKELRALPVLSSLELDTAGLSPASARAIAEFPKLQGLGAVDGSGITDEWLAELGGQQLRVLVLRNSQVTDAGVACLSGQESLDALSLQGSQITDACLCTLGRMVTSQGILDLSNTAITDSGLWLFSTSINPESKCTLLLSGTQVTQAGAERFLKERPNVNLAGIEGVGPSDVGDWTMLVLDWNPY